MMIPQIARRLIYLYGQEAKTLLDPFMGSGTTLLACIKLGIPVIGIDDSESSCEIATKRCSRGVK